MSRSYGASSTARVRAAKWRSIGGRSISAPGRRHRHHGDRLPDQPVPAGLLQVVEHPGGGLGGVVAGRHRDHELVGGVDRGLPVLRPHVVAGVHEDQLVEPADHLADLARTRRR